MHKQINSADHHRRVVRLLTETAVGFVFLTTTIVIATHYQSVWVWIPVVLQGLWLQRLYMVGHEASHRKLLPKSPQKNDFCGQIFLFLILVPITTFRQIHFFHHAHNRRNNTTSALDTYIVNEKYNSLKKVYAQFLWYLAVFVGGFFIHSLVSILILLVIPPKLALRISPAMRGWSWRKQLNALSVFVAALGVHIATALIWGGELWLNIFGFPLLVFAWVYSMLLYVYHYRTSIGAKVNENARSLRRGTIYSWWLLNFNEHELHHRNPALPWYRLPEVAPPSEPSTRLTLTQAILQQLRGATIIEEKRKITC